MGVRLERQVGDARLDSIERLLVAGGDPRIALDPETRVNRYLCRASPCPVAGFGSSTASIISPAGFAAAVDLRRRLDLALQAEPPATVYRRELDQLRASLVGLCGLDHLPGLQTLFAASGTDIHLLAAQFVGGLGPEPTIGVMVEAAETGSGVGLALEGRHFATETALGAPARPGQLVGGRAIDGMMILPARDASGAPRPATALRAELERAVLDLAPRARVLITVADLSKTGLISLDLSGVFDLLRQFPDRVEVLVDACQFRLSPGSLRAYLERGAMVAVTGSKFLGGPAFSGALFVPAGLAARFADQALAPGVGAYANRAELPAGWMAAADLPDGANFGLLARWTAALEDLRAFAEVPAWRVAQILRAFAATVTAHLADQPRLEAVPVPQLDRRSLGEGRWDSLQTIFPLLLRRSAGGRGRYLTPEETQRAWRVLAGRGIQLGQPVACGERDGEALSALRLCASARLVAEASRGGGLDTVLARIGYAIDEIALAARAISG